MGDQQNRSLHLVGTDVKHSIAYRMHNYIAQSLGLPWTFYNTVCPTFEHVLALATSPDTAGLVVTMPYKTEIMAHLHGWDELATAIGACNCVYFNNANPRLLCGSNTDWKGITGSILEKGDNATRPSAEAPGSALVIGAGGAGRAAVYALATQLHCTTIYVLNRDEREVDSLIHDCRNVAGRLEINHLKTEIAAASIKTPYYVIGTVPDVEPQTLSEQAMGKMLEVILSKPLKGVLHDMCFKPRQTRLMKLGDKLGWPCVEGIHAIGHQVEEQWRLWVGPGRLEGLDISGAWRALLVAADECEAINF